MGACKSKAAKPTRDEAEALRGGGGAEPQELSPSPQKSDAPVDSETPPTGEAKQLPLKAAKATQRDSCCSTSFSSSSGAPTADGETGERGKAGPVDAPGSPGVETVGDLRRRRLTVLRAPEKTEEADSAAGPQHASLADRFKRPVEVAARLAASRSTISQRVDAIPGAGGARTPGQSVNGAGLVERREEAVSLSTLVRQGSFSRSLHSSPPASVDGRLSLREDEERGERVDRGEGAEKGERKGRGSEAENEAELIQQIRREKSLPVAVEEDDPIAAKALSFSREQPPSVVTPSEADDASLLSGLGATTRSDAEARKLLVPCARGSLPVSRDTLWKHPEVLTASLFLDLFTPPQAAPSCCFLGAAAHCRQESFDDKVEDRAVRPPRSSVENVMRSLGFGFACKKGLKPDSPNQDDFAALCCSAFRLFGVFDGHGPSGHDVSGYVHRMLFALLLTDESLNRNPQLALRNAFVAVGVAKTERKRKRGRQPGNGERSGEIGTELRRKKNGKEGRRCRDSHASKLSTKGGWRLLLGRKKERKRNTRSEEAPQAWGLSKEISDSVCSQRCVVVSRKASSLCAACASFPGGERPEASGES
ncbi:putative PP2C [Toxoplasma gondii TgCatPRC2]|uniref:Putative PP2C n=1 Tax=Toxoplasma gondii TgCatPRC2 TaxID=1130821 RepID=A0A151HBG9_TOXGO|nr:putative PP2C [Toxoplasma gondii TgCatPRC2]